MAPRSAAQVLVAALLAAFGSSAKSQAPVIKQRFEFTVLAVTHVQEWVIPGSDRLPNGPLRIQAGPGQDVVIIRLNVRRLERAEALDAATATLHDSTGKTFDASYFPAKVGAVERHEAEFAFSVPKGTVLAKLQLTPTISIELKR